MWSKYEVSALKIAGPRLLTDSEMDRDTRTHTDTHRRDQLHDTQLHEFLTKMLRGANCRFWPKRGVQKGVHLPPPPLYPPQSCPLGTSIDTSEYRRRYLSNVFMQLNRKRSCGGRGRGGVPSYSYIAIQPTSPSQYGVGVCRITA